MADLDKVALDRHITGNYGEDQFPSNRCRNCDHDEDDHDHENYATTGPRPCGECSCSDFEEIPEIDPPMPDPCDECDWVGTHDPECSRAAA